MESQSIEVAALGRPLYPGMLYDCRNDSFIPGVTLWDRESLNKDLDTHIKPSTSFSVTTLDTIKEKSKLLDISGSLKASILGGIVEIGGSAKYLCDKASSLHQSRVTVQYGRTVCFEQLTMTHLGKVTYPQVFEQQSATHVVTAVLYGVQAFFVFNSTNSSKEDKVKIEGSLKMVLNKIPKLSGEVGGELNLAENEQEVVSGFTCTFHGDFELQRNPTNFTEAVEVYRMLPELLGTKGEKAVPLRVWLYPLRCLHPKAARLMAKISNTHVSRLESVLEELEDVILGCNDLMAESILQLFPELHDKIKEFHGSLLQYRSLFQKNLSCVLPAVRGGGKEQQDLASILESHECSPFSSYKLKNWLNLKRSETIVLKMYTKPLKDIHILFSNHVDEVVLDPQIDTTICFTFTSLAYSEPYLSALSTYLNLKHNKDQISINEENVQPWFRLDQCSSAMRGNLKLFTSFAEANQHRERIKLISAAISDPKHPGASIRLYQQAQLVDPEYIPVSEPKPAIAEDIQCYSATLRLFMSFENVEYYRMEYQKKLKEDESGAEGFENWTVIDTRDLLETWTLTGLQPGVTYVFRYRVVSAVGVGKASEITEFQTTAVPLKRSAFSQYRIQLLLDSDSAYERLDVRLGTCTHKNEVFPVPSHPDRFSNVPQVLARESLSESRFYWQVSWSGAGFCIGVAYKSISRKSAGNDSVLGLNDKSWCLCSFGGMYTSVWHGNKGEDIMKRCGDTLGIYLDWPAGTLTFYSVSSDKLVHLYTFHSAFTEPLYPAFYIAKGCTIDLSFSVFDYLNRFFHS